MNSNHCQLFTILIGFRTASPILVLLPVRERAVNETCVGRVWMHVVIHPHLPLKCRGRLVMQEQVAPRHTFYT